MHKFTFLIVLLFAQLCIAQINDVEKIDLKKYKGLEHEGYYKSEKNDTITEVRNIDNEYLVSKYLSKSNSINIKKYAHNTGILMEEGQKFSKVEVGITKIYDSNGKVYKEIDYDAPYAFSLEQVIELVKSKFNIDLTEKKWRRSADRYFNTTDKKYFYTVKEPLNESDIRILIIDGTTGIVISDTIIQYID